MIWQFLAKNGFFGVFEFSRYLRASDSKKNNVHYVEAVDTDFLEIKNDMFWWVLVLQDVGECKNAQMLKKCEKMKTTFVLQTAVTDYKNTF